MARASNVIYAEPDQGGELDEHDLAALIAQEINEATEYDQSFVSDKRRRAIEYYRGEMRDTPPRTHGSKVTSRDVADTMSWMIPSIMRVFMSSDRLAEYEPLLTNFDTEQSTEQAEEQADQASDYIAHCFMKDNNGYKIVYDATYNSLQTGDGIIKHWWDDTPQTCISYYTGQTAQALAELTSDDDVEILTQEAGPPVEMVDPATGMVAQEPTWNVKIQRTTADGMLRFMAVAPENFMIDDAAIDFNDGGEAPWRFCAHRDPYVTRSDLIEMGFDRDKVEELTADATTLLDTEEAYARRHDATLLTNSPVRSTERVDLYECYLKIDADGDGVAETIRVYYVGDAGAGTVLEWEVWEDDVPFSKIPCYPQPHRFDSHGVADRTMDIQQIRTILLRQMLDNLYASNLPQREIEQGSVLNPDALVSPKFGGIIWKKKGSQPIVPHEIPNTAEKTFPYLQYLDEMLMKRTGGYEQAQALDPETLQNQSATANQNMSDVSKSQVEMIARSMAELGWRRVFRCALKLVVKHQRRERIVRLRGKFVPMDPRHWNADMDCTINVGLGTGSRDRDMMMLQAVKADQWMIMDRLAQGGHVVEAFEMLPKIRNTMIRFAESAGLRAPDAYYPDFDEDQVAAMMAKAQQALMQEPPEIQIEKMKAEIDREAKMMDAEVAKTREAAQLEADMMTKEKDRQVQLQLAEQQQEFQREELAANTQLKLTEQQNRFAIEQMKLNQKEGEVQIKNAPQMAFKDITNTAQALLEAAQQFKEAAGKRKRMKAIRDENGVLIGSEEEDAETLQ